MRQHSAPMTGGGSTASSAVTVALTSPAEGAVLKGTVKLEASVSNAAVAESVTFQWDSEDLGPADTSAPFEFSWDTTKHTDGFFSLTAVIKTVDGQRISTAPVVVRVQNSATSTPNPPASGPSPVPQPTGVMRKVPQDYATIQAAINASANGDTVLVAPGTYPGGISVKGKAVTLASLYLTTGTSAYIDQTVISGGNPMLEIGAAGTRVVGLSFQSGSYAVSMSEYGEVLNCKFTRIGADSVSFEGSGGVVRGNRFIDPSDDAIDADGPMTALIEDNVITGAGDDGIEIRNFDYTGALQTITIRRNRIEGSDEDGIQLIDYPANSNRRFVVEKNIILSSADAGLGLMDGGNTVEDFRGASLPERIHVIGNTFSGNRYGITGGDNMAVVNNIITGSSAVGIKNTDGNSSVSHNLFFNNGVDSQGSNLNALTVYTGNPLFGADFKLGAGSPAINKGAASFTFRGEAVLQLAPASYLGLAPDLGAVESQ